MNELIRQFGDSDVLYVVFGVALLIFLVLDIALLQRSNKPMSIKSALLQASGWVSMALGYGYLVYHYHGSESGLQYVSAYLMEYSLSMDNIFVFILILSYFKVSDKYYHKVLFYGIIGAVIFRIIFIFLGIVIVERFHWVLYIFGAILIYTGVKILVSKEENEFVPDKNLVYKILKRLFPLVDDEGDGNFTIERDGKKYYTILFVVIMIIASTDLVFALDSIPAVFAISQDRLVIVTSNIFAVMGLRAMFFLLKGMSDKFDYLQEGISLVLIFIGVKMLLEIFDLHIKTGWSLAVIVSILLTAIVASLIWDKPKKILKENTVE
ncbi:MAG: TerC/Alx family metal homeostasis membrane protein [Chitinophagales bacterium]|nr:TerC/Alx family metal homeostasis membrane protein [Chitinophagales bacterium]